MNTLSIQKRAAALCAGLLFLMTAVHAANPQLKAGVFEPPAAAPTFTLQGSDGKPLKLERYQGKLVLLVFGFTRCPEVCPTTLATLAQARKELGAQADAVQVVYVTVDPERDDAKTIKNYLAVFDASFVGGTATPQTLADMRKRYGVFASRQGAPKDSGYGMNHSTSVYFIDGKGKLRAMMPYGRAAADYVHDVRLLLAAQ